MRYFTILIFSCYAFSFDPSLRSFYNFKGGNYLELHDNKIARGSGFHFKEEHESLYRNIISKDHLDLQWEVRNLSRSEILETSLHPKKLFYGASITKVFVASTFLTLFDQVSLVQRSYISELVVKSSNTAWTKLQELIGHGVEDNGRRAIQSFLNRLSIFDTIGFRGYLGDVHGNEVTTSDLGVYLQKSFDGNYNKSRDIFKVMFLSKTGSSRLKKFFPKSMIIGGKTGTYNGPTSVNSIPLNVSVKHHLVVFKYKESFYSIIVLSDGYSNEELASLGYGLYKDFIKGL